MRAQRRAATWLPVRALGPGGVIRTIFMPTTTTDRPTSGASAAELLAQLRDVRGRTLAVTEDLSSDELMGPKLAIVNPVLWELGHIAWFHEHWTLRHCLRRPPLLERGDRLWDSSNVPHDTRWNLDLPDRRGTLAYLADVLSRQGEYLQLRASADDAHYFYDLSIRHEDMHIEALAYTRQTLGYRQPAAFDRRPPARAGGLAGDVDVPGGTWQLGATTSEGFVFDNEKWAHRVEVAPFRIARAPVTNREFAEFVAAEGYRRREFWSDAGWAWRERTGAERPVYWQPKSGGAGTWRRYDQAEALAPDAPVVFITWYEAEAWCRWAKRRLPTEIEWEVAATGEPTGDGRLAERKRSWPWGEAAPSRATANLDFACDAPLDVADRAAGDSAFGCRQMTGNVWEWTASDFVAFPGFAADPYQDYSQPWFGTRKVLRGGAWATSARIARPAYRNFFTPDRNDVFAGFRTCAL
jgi:ergothioneine biosynthesis protein EgtB